MSQRLQDRVAFITGGNSGIGRAIVNKFVAEGARVGFTGRDQRTIDEVSSADDGRAIGIRSDIADVATQQEVLSLVVDRFGRLDAYIANAGVVQVTPFAQVDEKLYDHIMGINLKGLFFGIQAAVQFMNPGGAIVIVGTSMWPKGVPGYSVYNASKGAVRSLTRVLAAELAEKQLRVNHLSPGVIDTPVIDRQGIDRDQVHKLFMNQIPLGRLGDPEEMASAALFLASDESSYMTGADLMVDGGIAQV